MTEFDLSQIVSQAIFISEQIKYSVNNNLGLQKVNQELASQRINNWTKAVGSKENLQKRLEWDQLNFDVLCNLLGNVEGVKNYSLPFWGEIIKDILQMDLSLLTTLNSEHNLPIDPNNPLAFEDFYSPFILFSRSQLYSNFSEHLIQELISEEAYYSLERKLLQQLVNLGESTLLFEFDKFRNNKICNSESTVTETSNKVLYKTFIETLLQDQGFSFFKQYPVFARLLATSIKFWIESTSEFLQRLQVDLSNIKSLFSETNNIGKVKAIEHCPSSPHHHGRGVLSLKFDCDIKIVYKPKSLGLEVAFNQLQDWCNQQQLSLSLKLIKILDRQEYGWVEYVKHQPCEQEDEIGNFYKRAGMLLSLLYLLGSRNCQNIDVIAHREYPILIDADCLMSPVAKSFDESESWFSNSVIKVGFLPSWKGDYMLTVNAQDSSVFGGIFPEQVNSSQEWKFINTDQMQLLPKTVVIPAQNNVVFFQEKTVYPQKYAEYIVAGFQEIYRLLIKHKQTLLSEVSPLLNFKILKSKLSLNPTVPYRILSKKSLNPKYLVNGLDFSLSLERLARTYLTSEEKPESWAIFSAEIKDLQQLDIPDFEVACDHDSLELESNKPLEHFFKVSSYQKLITKLESLNEKDLELQINLIYLSFYSKRVHLAQINIKDLGTYSEFAPITSEKLVQEALTIGNYLIGNAVHYENGCNWIELEYMFRANRYRLKPLDNSLYLGRMGVSLFLAALAKVTGKNEFKEVALTAVSPIRQALKQGKSSLRFLEGELGILGYGGVIYSLTKISQFLQDSTLLEDAQQAVKLITAKMIAKDHQLDIIFGVAGAILGLLNLYQEVGDDQILDKARDCGNHLLSQRTNSFPRAWITLPSKSKPPLTGFSHGAAGIVVALVRLYTETKNTAYLEAAQEGIEYERSVFEPSARNWPDFRMASNTNPMNFLYAWCNGSTGIGLARLGTLPILQLETVDWEIQAALATTKEYCERINQDTDSLCCGTLGRTELFAVAAQKLGNQEWLNIARKQAAWIVARSRANQEYSFFGHLASSMLNPNFFKGSAGAGYQLLRLAYPDSLPSVLILE
ncbi:MAG: type 2 lantipeptide synthetase LanM [Symploca sp. SIO2E9]|nr:type 2 lantipeptide synthetase LanM [Symploca sp. SIO2E9]